ncbi:ABC transporter ATP-binding protein [Parafilimonas sp.]|uniref:ABC transporter ATP-binding protein n=1 Tax=Parafilimonas sp. TaxID=1969739 RepID=UPI0039E60012
MKKYSRVFAYLKNYIPQIILYFLCTVLSIVFSIVSIGMLIPFLELIFNSGTSSLGELAKQSNNPVVNSVRNILTGSIEHYGKLDTLLFICIFIVVSIFLKNLFLYMASYILNPLKNKIVNHLRIELYDKVLQLPIGYFTEKRKGDVISRITNDVTEVENSVVGTLEGWIRDPLTVILNVGFLFFMSPQLTLFLIVLIPVMGFVIGRISRSLKRKSNLAAIKQGESVSILDETLSGLRVIKAFNAEGILRSRFYKVNDELLHAKNHIGYRRDLASPVSELLGVMMFAIILWYGGSGILSGRIPLEASVLLGYLGLFYNIITPAKTLSTSFSNMQKGSAAITRIEEVLRATITVDDNPNGKKIELFQHAIEFRNVSFRYDDVTILKNINLTIEKGKTIALVGASGAGKSTLADLIPRFHDVSEGEILVDGINIKDYSLQSLREQISIVTQEPILFNDTVANNIALGEQDASMEAIESAAKVANAYNFIQQKEEKFNTNIGDRGSKLSGGERQRLTIARAILKNPPILILDEATSSLDTESEKLVQDAINNMMQNRTSVVIAHRLSTIRHADEIIVLQKGEIAERGTHEILMNAEGIYFRLVQMNQLIAVG